MVMSFRVFAFSRILTGCWGSVSRTYFLVFEMFHLLSTHPENRLPHPLKAVRTATCSLISEYLQNGFALVLQAGGFAGVYARDVFWGRMLHEACSVAQKARRLPISL